MIEKTTIAAASKDFPAHHSASVVELNDGTLYTAWIRFVGSKLAGQAGQAIAELTSGVGESAQAALQIATSATQQQAMMTTTFFFMLPMIYLSGFIFPIENMPVPMQVISYAVPSRWFYTIVKGIMLKGLGIDGLWKETLILAGMMFFYLAITLKKFKIRLA